MVITSEHICSVCVFFLFLLDQPFNNLHKWVTFFPMEKERARRNLKYLYLVNDN